MYEIIFSSSAQRYLKKIKDKNLKEKFREAAYKISEIHILQQKSMVTLQVFALWM